MAVTGSFPNDFAFQACHGLIHSSAAELELAPGARGSFGVAAA